MGTVIRLSDYRPPSVDAAPADVPGLAGRVQDLGADLTTTSMRLALALWAPWAQAGLGPWLRGR